MQVAITALTHVHVHPRGLQLGSRDLDVHVALFVGGVGWRQGHGVVGFRLLLRVWCCFTFFKWAVQGLYLALLVKFATQW